MRLKIRDALAGRLELDKSTDLAIRNCTHSCQPRSINLQIDVLIYPTFRNSIIVYGAIKPSPIAQIHPTYCFVFSYPDTPRCISIHAT